VDWVQTQGGIPVFKDGIPVHEGETITKRGHVMINDRDAEINNMQAARTKLIYIPADSPFDEMTKKQLIAYAHENGIEIDERAKVEDIKTILKNEKK